MNSERFAVTKPLHEIASERVALFEDFEAFVERHQKRIYRLLLGILRDPSAAEELSQECFWRAYQKRSSYRGESDPGAWLLKIAVNLARDYRRTLLRSFWRSPPSGPASSFGAEERLADSHPSPERAAISKESVATVWRAVGMLPAQQRIVFVLRYAEEMTLEEIAAATSLRSGTVKSHLFRAIKTVRKLAQSQE